jgi:deoxyribonuclease V
MAQKIIAEDKLPREIKLISGVDVAYLGDIAFGAAAVLDNMSFEVLEVQTVTQKVKFPYVPTLFSFREHPVVVACIKKLKLQPDVFLIDGHGRAHPYGCGSASHLGLVLGKPTVGVAKSMLVGKLKLVCNEVFLDHEGEVVGAVVPTRKGAKPVYVSVGHMVSIETAVRVVKHCIREARVSEPIRVAHKFASEERKAKIAL